MSRTASAPDPEPRPGPGRALTIATVVLAAYSAVATTVLLLGGRTGSAAGDAMSQASSLDRQLLDEQARKLRGEIAGDFKKAVDETKQQCAAIAEKADRIHRDVKKAIDSATRQADDLSKSWHARLDPLSEEASEIKKDLATAKTTLDSLTTTVREIEKRPAAVAAAPTPATPAPAPVAPTPAKPTPEAPPPSAPADDPVARKERVKAAIADLSDSDPGKVWAAASTLGQLGDLDAVEPLVKVMREQKDALLRIAAAAALGTLHACDAVPAIIETFGDKNLELVTQAGKAFYDITGEDTGLSSAASRKDRTEAKAKWSKWWKENEEKVRAKWGQSKGGDAPPAEGAMEGS